MTETDSLAPMLDANARIAELESEIERLRAPRGSRHWTREVDGRMYCSTHGQYPKTRLPACPVCCDEQIAEINVLSGLRDACMHMWDVCEGDWANIGDYPETRDWERLFEAMSTIAQKADR